MSVRQLIHAVDPYIGLDIENHQPDLQGWGGDDPIFASLIEEIEPRNILEVGSWKGASALHMAKILNEKGLHGSEICCVDTWLGAVESWTNHEDPERYKSLRLANGYPTVYYTFLKNVAVHGVQRVITPFPVPSTIAARFFVQNHVRFDLIYIDTSHDYEDVLSDVKRYWPLVAPNGVLFGDDYGVSPGVTRAVDCFAADYDLTPEISDHNWVFRKGLLESWLGSPEVDVRRQGFSFEAFSRVDHGYGFAGWLVARVEGASLVFDHVERTNSPRILDRNSFFGVMLDFELADGRYTRVALYSAAFGGIDRVTSDPHWGKAAPPDRAIPIALNPGTALKLANYRPADAVGRVIVAVGLQNVGPGVAARGRLVTGALAAPQVSSHRNGVGRSVP